MNLLKKLSLFSALIIAFSGLNTCAMGQFARKAFHKGCTATGWAIPAGILYAGALGHRENDRLTMTLNSKVNPAVDEMVNYYWQKRGHNTTVDVRQGNEFRAIKQYNGITIPTSDVNSILNTINKINSGQPISAQEERVLLINLGTIQHELGHLEQGYHSDAFGLTTPFITHFGIKAVKSAVVPTKYLQPSILKSLLKIPGAFPKLMISAGLIAIERKIAEQDADNRISDDIPTLKTLQSFFELMHIQMEDAVKDPNFKFDNSRVQFLKENISAQTLQKYPVLWELFDKHHPSLLRRAQKFEQRVKKLEEQA